MTENTQAEFLALLQRHAGVLHKIVRLYADDAEDRRDLHQEILYEAWRAYPGFRGASAFSTWLYRVALNTALTFRRKVLRSVATTELSVAQQFSESEPPALSAQAEMLDRAIRQLPGPDRAILVLHLEEHDNAAIAEITGLSKNHVAVKLHRIKTELENRLKSSRP